MELVYLWVEDYKNIKKQGFNFSPRFECTFHDKYDEKGKLKDGCNLDIQPKEYIENFFGDNINVTAIVGKNGSGKSSVLKILKKYINNIHHRKESPINAHGSNYIEWTKENEYYIDEKILIVFYSKKDEKFYYQSSFELENNDLLEEALHLSNISYPLFDYSLTYDKEISKKDEVFPTKYHVENNKKAIVFDIEHSRNIENIIKNYFYLKNEFYDKFKDFFVPKKILLGIDLTIAFESDIWVKNGKGLSFTEISELSDEKSNEYIEKYFRKNPIGNITTEALSDKVSNIKFSKLLKEYLKKYPEQKNKKVEQKENYIYTVFEIDIDDLEYDKDEDYKDIESIAYSEFECKRNIDNEKFDDSTEFLKKSSLGNILKENFSIDLKDEINNKLYNDLSFGEQQLINILNQIYALGIKHYIYKIYDTDVHLYPDETEDTQIWDSEYVKQNIKNFIIFFDEIDIGFHPDWQKRTIQYIIDFLSLIPDKNFHLIFTTHSPFLLSDIPKQNITFLDKYDNEKFKNKYPNLNNGNCINVTKEIDIKPFGANIHNLLAHGFFMEDGLMGEFALQKIQSIVTFYNDVKNGEKNKKEYDKVKKEYDKVKNEFHFIRDNIGEEYIKGVITNHIESIEERLKDESFKKRRIKQLNEKLKELGAKYDTDLLS